MPKVMKDTTSERQQMLKVKAEKVMDESVWPFLTAIIFNYNLLSEQRQHEMKRRYNKMLSCFADEGKKRFTYNNDRLIQQAVMAACARYYPDVNDKSFSQFCQSYLRSKSAKSED
jgi:hypothetical protein